ncbi:hypothetical protein SLEP1_g38984 [Rubroshorea leprosula]|uniref:Uncharacterized protein n=1 Tax=Rubroshorea leprosula TaxID=152421 RepID=A0AAV5KZG3_9ROSI|nr:hypothetical protein SLEP1_g38984 [Rubroshorea leprosula]
MVAARSSLISQTSERLHACCPIAIRDFELNMMFTGILTSDICNKMGEFDGKVEKIHTRKSTQQDKSFVWLLGTIPAATATVLVLTSYDDRTFL